MTCIPRPRLILATLALVTTCASSLRAEESRCFELRTYHAHPGKIEALHARFRDHTLKLFEKHGMTNVIYWSSADEPDVLIYLLSYPDRDARVASWAAFREDPEWKKVYRESTESGKLVAKVESLFLELAPYSPVASFPELAEPRIFEMRRYTTRPGKLEALDARFRDHTIGLFEKHGVTNLPYLHLAEDEEGSDSTLLYFIAAPTRQARDGSFEKFGADPVWKKARDESQKDGPLLVPKGVASTFLETTDYSPVR